MSVCNYFEKIDIIISLEERTHIEGLKHRFNCKTDASLFRKLIWFFDDFDKSIFECQKSVDDLRSALYECLGIVSK